MSGTEHVDHMRHGAGLSLIPHDHGQPTENVLEHMPDPEQFVEAAAIFQQIGDGSRLRILWLLCHCEECVCDIAAAVGMSAAASPTI